MAEIARILRRLGGGVIDSIWRLGYASRFLAMVLGASGWRSGAFR